ncbi:MAG: DUF6326 family protein [Bacteroidia bacterium]|nr:DUF6326 family protein [Bacteroidia bacterium]
MYNKKLKPQSLLSSLWIFVLFNMILRDLHEFPTEGYIEEMMGLHLSEESMLFFAFIVEIPILMVILPRILTDKANKWMNLIAVILSSLGILYTLPGGHLDEYFFAAMNLGAFFLIIRTAWRMPAINPA